MLWLAVGLSIRHSLIFLVNRPLFGALLVGCGSPLSYLTGERFGAVEIPSMDGLAGAGRCMDWTFLRLYSAGQKLG
jgi:hypothetical protein